MNGQHDFGIYLHIRQDHFCYKKWPMGKPRKSERKGSPFFSILTEDSTAKLFIDAVLRNAVEEANCYISRSLRTELDLSEVRQVLGSNYKCLIKAEEENDPLCRTDSVLIIHEERRNSILHVHMIKEPDGFGNWKIFGIERE